MTGSLITRAWIAVGLRRAAALAIALLIVLPVAACTSNALEPAPVDLVCPASAGGDVTVVVGARQNSPAPKLPKPIVELITEAAKRGSQVEVIRLDGAPTVSARGRFETKAKNDVAVKAALNQFMEQLFQTVAALQPRTPEADVLTALDLAARDTAKGGTVVLLDSGLQTTGRIKFQEAGVWGSAPDELASYLVGQGVIPDFSDKAVVFAGLGDTAPPQSMLTPGLVQSVAEKWTTIAKRGNSACVQVLAIPTGGASIPTTVPVTVVPIPTGPAGASCAGTVLSNSVVEFLSNTATFRDPATVTEVLAPLAAQLMGGTQPVTLIGTTASDGTEASRTALSRARAEAVKTALVQLGVPTSRISTVGAGINNSNYVNDRDSDGGLLPAQAALNRSVIVQLLC